MKKIEIKRQPPQRWVETRLEVDKRSSWITRRTRGKCGGKSKTPEQDETKP